MVTYQSINFKNTSLQDRESYFKTIENQMPPESVFLQTCNRMELYSGNGDVPKRVARHLFRVVSGLESAIVGERAVQGQVKEAYLKARNDHHLPAGIHKLFECALEVGKRVRNETEISHGAVSHSLAAVEIMEEEQVDLKHARITIIGVNKLTSDILKFLQNKGAQLLFLGNRSLDRAHELADPLGIKVFGLEEKKNYLKNTDILISATSAPSLVVTTDDIERDQKLLAIDLAFPRDIDAEIATYPNVHLYNLRDLENRVKKNIEVRSSEVEKAEAIIEDEIEILEDIMERRKLYATK